MGRAPSSGDGNQGSPTGLIDVQVGEVYDNVRTVAENIDTINTVVDNLDELVDAEANIVVMAAHRTAAEQAASDADADRIAAGNHAATATAQVPLAEAQVVLAADQVALAIAEVAAAAAHAAAAAVSAVLAGDHADSAEIARVAAEAARAAAELAAQNAAAGAAFGTLGGAPDDNALLVAKFGNYLPITQKGVANGIASLNTAGQLFTSQIPAIAFIDTYERGSEAEQLGLLAERGDVCVRSDENKSYIHNGGSTGTMADWTWLKTPTDIVLSVNGLTGAITLGKADLGLGNVDNTSDANKPVSTAMATALALKLDLTGGTLKNGAGSLNLTFDAVDGQARLLWFRGGANGTVNQYSFGTNSSGGFGINRYNYLGAWQAETISFNRTTGDITFNDNAILATGKNLTLAGSQAIWFNTNKMYALHNGSHGYVRSEVGNLVLGAGGFNLFTLEPDGDGHLAGDFFVGGDDLTIGGASESRLNFTATGGGYWYGSGTNTGFFKAGGAHFYINHSTGDLNINGNIPIVSGKYIQIPHTNSTDANDGKIGAGLFDSGLNIVGTDTGVGRGREIRMWGRLTHGDTGAGIVRNGEAGRTGGKITASSSAPAGGESGDIHFQF